MTIQEIFNEIKAVKAALATRIAEIDADVIHSGEYKLAQSEEAREQAKARLAEINAEADDAIRVLMARTEKKDAFDYTDPRLLAAVNFIQANGSKLPEAAWSKMVKDFDGKSRVLFYLSELFDSHGLTDAAITANEAAKGARMTASFPQRVADAIYYATSSDPGKNVDFSGYEKELSRIEEVLARGEAEAAPAEGEAASAEVGTEE